MHEGRGVSSTLGITLLFAIVLSGTFVVVGVGATALDETQDQMGVERAEKTLTQFDSKVAMVALGQTNRQGVSLAQTGGASYHVREDAGWMNVTVTDTDTGDERELVNTTLGTVSYDSGTTGLAYQGGGVWKRTEAGTTMVSPPEFHFRSATLTLPIITVEGTTSLDRQVTVTRSESTSIRYPNASQDSDFVNPLEGGVVNVTVHSEYYRSWGRFFEQRTQGAVTYDDDNETAQIELVVPFEEDFENVVATTTEGGITANGRGAPANSESGVSYPSADSRVESAIADCEDGSCDESTPLDSITSPGTYYVDGDYSGGLDADTSDGNVTVVVDGNVNLDSATISGDNTTRLLVRGDFASGAYLNDGGSAESFAVLLHSDGGFSMNGNSKFVGLLYAPGSDCSLNGNAYVVGGSVCETISINGNPNDFDYRSSITNMVLDLNADSTSEITYLHVTLNEVNVSSR